MQVRNTFIHSQSLPALSVLWPAIVATDPQTLSPTSPGLHYPEFTSTKPGTVGAGGWISRGFLQCPRLQEHLAVISLCTWLVAWMRFIVIYVNTAGRGFASYTGKWLISFAPGKQTQGRPGISSLPALRFANNSGWRVTAPVPGQTQLSRKSGLAGARAWLVNGK